MKAPAVRLTEPQLHRGEFVVLYDQVPEGNELAEYAVTVDETVESWNGPEYCPENPTFYIWALRGRMWSRGVAASAVSILGEELPFEKGARAAALIHAARIGLWG